MNLWWWFWLVVVILCALAIPGLWLMLIDSIKEYNKQRKD
tara:strand:+ start:163 stop:282 length:120 start_codon:yes stop_codon:yes gene_type:complete